MSANTVVFAINPCALVSLSKRAVAAVAASGDALLGSIGAAPPFGVASVIEAPLSNNM